MKVYQKKKVDEERKNMKVKDMRRTKGVFFYKYPDKDGGHHVKVG
jgi:hypothetical protein